MTELKPCPFCGGGTHYYAPAPIDHRIQCERCFAETGGFLSKEAAIKAWNTRAERTCKWTPEYDGEFYATECGAKVFWEGETPPKCMYCGAKVVE